MKDSAYSTSLIALLEPSFSLEKKSAPKKQGIALKIGKVAEHFGVQPSVLRFWEEEFPQLQPERTDKGQRLYYPEDIALIQKIHQLLHKKGMTIEGAKKVLTKSPHAVKSKKIKPAKPKVKALSLQNPVLSSATPPVAPTLPKGLLKELYSELTQIKQLLEI